MQFRSRLCSALSKPGLRLLPALSCCLLAGCNPAKQLPPAIAELCPDTRIRVGFGRGEFSWEADQHELKASLVPLEDECIAGATAAQRLCDDHLWRSLLLDHAEALVRWGEPRLDTFKSVAFRTSVDDAGVESPAVVVRVVEDGAGAVLTTKVIGHQRDQYGASWSWRRTQALSPSQWASLKKRIAFPSLRDTPTYVVRGQAKFDGGGLLGPILEVYDGKRYRFFVGAEALPSGSREAKPTWLTNAVAAMKEYARCN